MDKNKWPFCPHLISFSSYVLSLIPKINFTIPLKNFGTFFTTIVIIFLLFYEHNHIKPTLTTTTPIMNSQPDIGSNNTNKIPKPSPIRQTANVFFNILHIILPPIICILYYLFFIFVTIYVMYILAVCHFSEKML